MAIVSLSLISSIINIPLSLVFLLYLIVRPLPTKIPIKNRHVFIIDGSSGIGLELAQQAASQGAQVSILARSLNRLEEAKQSIKLATSIDVAVYSADVRDFEAVKSAIDQAGPIDILMCNQGVFVDHELENSSIEELNFMIDINLKGTFHLIKAAFPGMENRAGRGPGSISIMSSK